MLLNKLNLEECLAENVEDGPQMADVWEGRLLWSFIHNALKRPQNLQEHPGKLRNTQEGTSSKVWEHLGTFRNAQELPGILRDAQKSQVKHRNA